MEIYLNYHHPPLHYLTSSLLTNCVACCSGLSGRSRRRQSSHDLKVLRMWTWTLPGVHYVSTKEFKDEGKRHVTFGDRVESHPRVLHKTRRSTVTLAQGLAPSQWKRMTVDFHGSWLASQTSSWWPSGLSRLEMSRVWYVCSNVTANKDFF